MEKRVSLFELIDDNDIISFDIYDTLLKRKVISPYHIFELTQLIYEQNHASLEVSFCKIRKISEHKARKGSLYEEVTIDNIYEEMYVRYKLDKYAINELKNIELMLEKDFIEVNKEMLECYNYARQNGKKVIITSDMYLPIDTIEDILKKNNILNYEKLYLSSQTKKTKLRGSIYQHIVDELNVGHNKILHIGDNKKSDYDNAIANKINAYWYCEDNKYEIDKNKCIGPLQILNHGAYNKLNNSNYWYNFGVENVGILYYTFIKYLINNIKKEEIDKVLFLARDGQVLKKVYDMIAKEKNLPESYYFYASRRCLNIPSIYELNEKDIDILLSNINGKNIEYLFKKVGLNHSKYKNIIDKYSIDKININIHAEQIKNMIHELKTDILLNAKEERITLIKYIKKHDLNNKKVAVIDIGWNGTLQYSLSKICEKEKINTSLYGYYLGISEKSKEYTTENNKYNGFLFENRSNYNFKIISSFNAFFEELFIADHGSVIKLKSENDDIVPILEEFEYTEEEYLKLKNIQNGAFDYISNIYDLDKNYNLIQDISSNAMLNISNIFLKPSYEDIDKLGKLKHYDYDVKFNCNPLFSVNEYLLHPQKLLHDYKQSKWKIGFIKKIFRSDAFLLIFKLLKGYK